MRKLRRLVDYYSTITIKRNSDYACQRLLVPQHWVSNSLQQTISNIHTIPPNANITTSVLHQTHPAPRKVVHNLEYQNRHVDSIRSIKIACLLDIIQPSTGITLSKLSSAATLLNSNQGNGSPPHRPNLCTSLNPANNRRAFQSSSSHAPK